MHPTDRKSINYAYAIIALALIITSFSFIKSSSLALVILVFGIAAAFFSRGSLVLISFFLIISLPLIILVVPIYLADINFWTQVLASVIFSPFLFIFWSPACRSLRKFTNLVNREKEDADMIEKFPDLICQEHLARTKIKKTLGFKTIACRIDKKCIKQYKRIINWTYLVGRIGDFKDTRFNNDSYYIDIWNHRTKEI